MMLLNHIHGGNIREVARKHGLKYEDIIDFSASINPLGMSKKACNAVLNQLDSALHYPEQFADTLTAEISAFHEIPRECIIAGNGSTELIYLIPRVFKPKRALIVSPAFSEYSNALEVVGSNADRFFLTEENGFIAEIKKITSALKNKYDIFYLCNPGNPTGVLTSKNHILEITDKAALHGTICVIDEAFIDFSEEESLKKEAISRSNLVVLRSMTKFFGIPGLRIGYAISSKDNIERMMVYKEPWSVNILGSIAAIESLRDKEYIEKSRNYITKERNFLFTKLAAVPWLKPYPSTANYVLVRIEKDNIDADILFDTLARKVILIRSCTSFNGLGNRFFRVAVRTREGNERLIKLLQSL